MTDTAYALALLVAMGFVFVPLLRRALKNSADAGKAPIVLSAETPPDARRCVCGELATDPTPRLERGRGSSLRDALALPPSYRRTVDRSAPPTLCRPHAHLADAALAAFCTTEIRAPLMRAYQEIAASAAAFEQGKLGELILASLSPSQRLAAREAAKPAPVLNGVNATAPAQQASAS